MRVKNLLVLCVQSELQNGTYCYVFDLLDVLTTAKIHKLNFLYSYYKQVYKKEKKLPVRCIIILFRNLKHLTLNSPRTFYPLTSVVDPE